VAGPSVGPGELSYRQPTVGSDRGGCLEDAEQDVHEVGGERLHPEHGPGEWVGVDQAVRSGFAASAKVIAAAAIIMIAVFASFILNADPTVKQFGVGLSVGVLLAGTMMLLLAPALLTLFGR
jgi:hypothetical protein